MLTELALLALGAIPQSPRDFPTAKVVPGALDGEFVGNGDFDGDGDIDLLHFAGTITSWTGVRIFRNDGAGAFTPGPLVTFAFPTAFQSQQLQPLVGDFNGDGKLDFVIRRMGSPSPTGQGVEFFLGDGAGGIAARLLLPLFATMDRRRER
jgi:hypothetical protein